MNTKDLLKGTLKPIILKLIKENRKMYGYEITQKVKELSGGQITLSYGGLYPILHKLESDGEVLTELVNVDNRLRKYYYLTKKGEKTADKKIEELEKFLGIIAGILRPNLKSSLCVH